MKLKIKLFTPILVIHTILHPMGFINGNKLVNAVAKRDKNNVLNLLKNNNISDEYKSKALYKAISQCDKEFVDILIDHCKYGVEHSRFKIYKIIGSDQEKFELFCYAFGLLFLNHKSEKYNKDEKKVRYVVNQAYAKYQFKSETDPLKIIEDSTGIEKNCCNLIIDYCGFAFTEEDKIKTLRNDPYWLKFIISELVNTFTKTNFYLNSTRMINDSKHTLYGVKLLLSYMNPEFKEMILKAAKEKKCKKLIAMVEESIDKDREYIV